MSFHVKKIISVILMTAMLFSLSRVSVLGEEIESGTETVETIEQEKTESVSLMSATASVEGEGTVEHPYLIKTEADLFALANEELTNALSANYELQNDITVTATTWVPIGNDTAFSGHFDGNGYTVSGVVLEGSGYQYTGFFGKNSGLIENLTVDVTFSASKQLGGLAAHSTGTIRNCLTKGTLTSTSNLVGGLVGENYNGAIIASGSAATVTGGSYVGGLVGRNHFYYGAGDAALINCYAQGNVTGSDHVGGLVGYNYSESGNGTAFIRHCYAAGKVNDGEGAGLVGSNNGRVYNSYYRSINTGNLIGYSVSTTEMKKQDTFYMWDFDHVWEISGNYPVIHLRGAQEEVSFQGDGSAANPYLIETEEQLAQLAHSAAYMGSANQSYCYQLANDITVTAKFWTPIGEYASFHGTFDGNGHTISGVKTSGTNYQYVGLFGVNDGTIKNLTVNGNVSGQNNVGVLTGVNRGTVENCVTKGSVTGTSNFAGGIAGENYNGTISASGSTAVITGGNYVGGLVGRNHFYYGSGDAAITNCYAQGNVTGSSQVGGLVGYNYGESGNGTAVIRNCYVAGKVNDGEGAGLVCSNNGRVYNSYYRSTNTGNLTGFSVSVTDLKKQDTFYMWDFDHIWEMNGSYPYINVRGETPKITFEGDGDIESPYYVETEEQLYALAAGEAKTGSKICYQLANDITVTAKFWMPIGEYDSFVGIFDGDGHTISGIKTSGTNYQYIGLFGANDGTIKNLTVNGNVSGQNNVGVLTGINRGTIENCTTEGAAAAASNFAGGIAGENYNGTISTSGSTAAVTGSGYVGGLVGRNHFYYGSGDAALINCYAQGDVTGSRYVGGLVGHNYGESGSGTVVIRNCYAAGKVNDGAGAGLVDSNNGRIYNSYYNGENNSQNNVNYKNGYPVSLEELASPATFYMWDFDYIWEVNGSYPYINVRGETPKIEFEGDGDSDIPYYVETEEQLYALAMGEAKTGSKIYYQLANDIAITAKFWMPIGEYDSFVGIFDGNGHTISGVRISDTNYQYIGLFGCSDGTIQNLTVQGDVSGQNHVGILIGNNRGTIENCLTEGTAAGAVNLIGGLAGENYNGTISTSGSTAAVSGSGYVGGLVGRNHFYYGDRNAAITNCYAHGDVTATGYAGGLVGYNYYEGGSYTTAIQYCYSIGAVTGSRSTGGIVGENNGVVTASYYNSETSGQTDTVKGTPVTTADMKVSSTYAGWDFDQTWAMSENVYDGYPYLQAIIPVERVAVTGISLKSSTLSLVEGSKEILTATVIPENATNKEVVWKSSNTAAATVSDGIVTAKKTGKAIITATTADGGYTASCTVTVTAKEAEVVSVTGITLNQSAVSLEQGKTETLIATVMPENATNQSVAWSSSEASVASVQNGVVKALQAGTTVITATTADGEYTASCEITVTEKTVDENAPTIQIKKVKARPGNEVDVVIELEKNTGFADLGIEVGYPQDVMTLTNVTPDSNVGGTFTPAQTYTVNPFNMGWASGVNITYNGSLATLTFEVADDAADGFYPITLDYYKGRDGNYVDGDDVNYDENEQAVGFVYISGGIVVASYIPGDINGDEKVNNKDATALLRYLAGWDVDGINTDALDTDGSGMVNNKDATHLLRYLAGWSVTLH